MRAQRGTIAHSLLLLGAGLLLAAAGAPLACEEAGLVGDRRVAGDRRAGALARPLAELEAAEANLLAAGAEPAEKGLALAMWIERRLGPSADATAVARRHERLTQFATRAAKASPLDAAPWCVLALAEAQSDGMTARAAELLAACHGLGPREVGLFEGRIFLGLAAWERLPPALRSAALADAAAGLRNGYTRAWMADRLAYAAAVIAPNRSILLAALVEPYGDELAEAFALGAAKYRRATQRRGASASFDSVKR